MPKKSPVRTKRLNAVPKESSLTIRFTIIAAAILVVFGVTWGTYLTSTTTVERIDISGSHHAVKELVTELSAVHVGDTLFAADPDLIASRIQHHPWVEEASVTRWPTGTLAIDIREREPVTLVIGQSGIPLYFLDRFGVMLPVDTLAHYDVPLLRGVVANPKTGRVDDEDTLELLGVLAKMEPESDDLISDLVRAGSEGFDIVTVPFKRDRGVRIKLGKGHYERKLAKLVAFWEQAVVGRTDPRFEWIDLRFEGQVITKET